MRHANLCLLLLLALCLLATSGSVYAPCLCPDKLVVKGDGNESYSGFPPDSRAYCRHWAIGNYSLCRLCVGSMEGASLNETYLSVPAVPDTRITPGGLPSFEMDATPLPIRVYITHYVAGGVAASGIPSAVGQAASYAHRAENGKILAARLNPVAEITPFGSIVVIPNVGEFAIWDTGAGFEDGRLWIDLAVSTRGEAIERGAKWIDVWVIKK